MITASLGGFEHWSYCAECPEMAVALILLLDQFRRNLYRGTRFDLKNTFLFFLFLIKLFFFFLKGNVSM